MNVFFLTAFTLIAFAANSFLCRAALGGGLIDPVSFTTIRLVSGTLILLPIVRARAPRRSKGSWSAGIVLFVYAIAFSLAFVSLDTGIGALVLFGSAQVTMLGAALRARERLRPVQWLGAAAAIGGLGYLVLPGASAPEPLGVGLMFVAGLGWGVYSILGKGEGAPLSMTAANFARSAPFAVVASLVAVSSLQLEPAGVLLALICGAVTSGLGYVIWYSALKGLTRTQASVVLLLVPVLAAFAGVVFLDEPVSGRLIVASALILGGVGIQAKRPSTDK